MNKIWDGNPVFKNVQCQVRIFPENLEL